MPRLAAVLPLLLLIAACAPVPTSTGGATRSEGQPARAERQPTLVISNRLEPPALAARPPLESFANTDYTAIFNAALMVYDDQAVPRGYLAEDLPRLNTESWQVSPDGRMRTTYHMRPNISWHDGTPFSTEDFVFAWHVYAAPDMGTARQPPFDAIERVESPDPRTLVISWKRPFPDADRMTGRDKELAPLPRHLLEASFTNDSLDTFLTSSFWTRDYVGLGPYRLTGWEPGAYLEGEAFDGHVTGRPKIDRLRFVIIGDFNTALANILSGEIHLAAYTAIGVEQALTLKREWEPRGSGTVINHITVWRGIDSQFRPELQSPRALSDVRVRKALAYAVDKPGLNEAINSGLAIEADYILPSAGEWGEAVQRGAVKYAYDARTAEQLMREAGFEKGPDGLFASPSQGRLTVEVKTTAGNGGANELAALASDWQRAGFDISQVVVPPAMAQDLETRAGFPGMFVQAFPATDRNAAIFTADNIPNAENRWRGGNRSGWTNPEYTRLIEQFGSTLDHAARAEQLARMARVFTDEAASISLYFTPSMGAVVTALKGPSSVPTETGLFWNMKDWRFE